MTMSTELRVNKWWLGYILHYKRNMLSFFPLSCSSRLLSFNCIWLIKNSWMIIKLYLYQTPMWMKCCSKPIWLQRDEIWTQITENWNENAGGVEPKLDERTSSSSFDELTRTIKPVPPRPYTSGFRLPQSPPASQKIWCCWSLTKNTDVWDSMDWKIVSVWFHCSCCMSFKALQCESWICSLKSRFQDTQSASKSQM